MCDEFNMVNQIVVRHMPYTVIRRMMTYNGHRAYAKGVFNGLYLSNIRELKS